MGAAGAAPTTALGLTSSRVMRFSAGGATGECACRYRANASMSTSPPSGAVQLLKTLKPSPPSAMKLFSTTR